MDAFGQLGVMGEDLVFSQEAEERALHGSDHFQVSTGQGSDCFADGYDAVLEACSQKSEDFVAAMMGPSHTVDDVVGKAWNLTTVNVVSRQLTRQFTPIFHTLEEDESAVRICDFLSHRSFSGSSFCASVQKAQNDFLSLRSISGSSVCSNSQKVVDDFLSFRSISGSSVSGSMQRAMSEISDQEVDAMNHDASKSSTPVKRLFTGDPEEHFEETSPKNDGENPQNPAKKARQCAATDVTTDNAGQSSNFIRVGGFLIPLVSLTSNAVPQPSSSADTKRRNWHRTCAFSFHKSFGKSAKSCKECVQTEKMYNAHWCSVCWKEGMEKNGSPILIRFKTCKTHRAEYLRKDCPCGRRWTDCLDCKDRGVDLRAGTAFCNICRKRYGGGGIDFCYCKA